MSLSHKDHGRRCAMSRNPGAPRHWLQPLPCEPPLGADALQSDGPPASAAVIAPVPPGAATDLDLPQRRAVRGSTASLHVGLNSHIAGIVEPNGGHISGRATREQYTVIVDSYGRSLPNQFCPIQPRLRAGGFYQSLVDGGKRLGGEFGVAGTRNPLSFHPALSPADGRSGLPFRSHPPFYGDR